jgi:uncharacterized Zn ribbon protein
MAHERATKTFDSHGNPLHIGDFYVTSDGKVYKLNGMSAVPQPGINAEYAYQVRKATPEEAATWKEQHPKAADGDSIIWGS